MLTTITYQYTLNTNDGGGKSNVCLVANADVGINNTGAMARMDVAMFCKRIALHKVRRHSHVHYISEYYVFL
jgi:hypothetical protein